MAGSTRQDASKILQLISKSRRENTLQAMFRPSLEKFKYLPVLRRFVTTRVISYDDKSIFPPEEGHVINSSFPGKLVVPEFRLDEYVWSMCKQWPNHTATICGITGRQYTFAQLRDKSAKMACALYKTFGIRAGDVVAICLQNLPEWPIACLGALEAGAVVTTINPMYTPEEIVNQLVNTSSKVIISTVESYSTVRRALQLVQHAIKPIVIKTSKNDTLPAGAIDFYSFIEQQEIFPFENPRTTNDVAIIPFSSGTTGLPKGVEITHFNILSNFEMLSDKSFPGVPASKTATADFQESNPSYLPYFHIYGVVRALFGQMVLGCKLITLPKFAPDTFLKCLIEHKATLLQVVPPVVIFCGKFDGATPKHFEHVWSVTSAAAPLKSGDVERFLLKAPHAFVAQGYGLTETTTGVLASRVDSTNYNSIGSPMPATQVKIVALDGSHQKGLGPSEKGELWVRGTQIMRGYFNNPEATKETIVDGNWFRTGDVGYYDENNEFYITDRLKELIKVKGFQVAPAELEEVLRRHPAVADAAVIGVEDERLGEVPKAFVVLKDGVKGVKSDEIERFVDDKVVKYKRLLGGVVVINQIPKTNTGKILRRVLKDEFC